MNNMEHVFLSDTVGTFRNLEENKKTSKLKINHELVVWEDFRYMCCFY